MLWDLTNERCVELSTGDMSRIETISILEGRDVEDWEQLVSIGFATKSRENWYHVSDDGRIFLEWVTGIKFLPESD